MTNLEKAEQEYRAIALHNPDSIIITAAIKDLTDAIRESNRRLPGLSEDSYTKPSGRGGPSGF